MILSLCRVILEIVMTESDMSRLSVLSVLQETGMLCLQMLLITVILYPFYLLGVLGAGDVKLCSMCAAFLEWKDCPSVFFKVLLLAAAAGLVKMIFYGNVKERLFYFFAYTADVIRLGRIKPYWTEENRHLKAESSLRLAGPLLAGVLLHLYSST